MNTPPVPSVPPPSSLEVSPNPVLRLFGSVKGLLTLIVVLGCFAALFAKAATWPEISEFLKWILLGFFGAHGVEEAARHVATGMSQRHTDASVTVKRDG